MKILVYKRTHVGDPDLKRQFGNQGCMGRVRGFEFDAVIGVGGVSGQPTHQGIAGKLNWIGRFPSKSHNRIDSRGPLVSFKEEDFRLFEQQGPLLSKVAPLLSRKVFGSRARFVFRSLNSAEQREAELLLVRVLDDGEFDNLQLKRTNSTVCGGVCRKVRVRNYCSRIKSTPNPSFQRTACGSR